MRFATITYKKAFINVLYSTAGSRIYRWWRTALRLTLATALTLFLCEVTLRSAGSADAPQVARTAKAGQAALAYDWQALGRDNSHRAYQNDTNMSVSIAPKLGVQWMTNLLSPDVGGPAIAYNPTVGLTLVYTGDERGNMAAYNEGNGKAVWSTSIGVGDALYSTPMVSSDEHSVWVGSVFNDGIWKLDAATGAIGCSIKTQLGVQGSPTEGTTSGGVSMVYASSIDATGIAGPELGITESNCTLAFSSNPYKVPFTGAWASTAYGVDANGRRLIIIGTADPDSSEYAMDATTGVLDWSFSTGFSGDYDIGAAATVSAPGTNGFAHGLLYFIDKIQIAYALDLTTGAPLWKFDFGKESKQVGGNARSAAALAGNTLVFGMSNGVYALNATTGAKLWHYVDPAGVEVISNPAIVGPPGQEVVAFGDLAGVFHVLSLASGTELYHYQTGNYITASPAYVNGHFLIASFDGFLYDFAAGGGNGGAPKTTITSPGRGATLPYANIVNVNGKATDAAGVNSVQVAVQSGGNAGTWYNAATKSWGSGALTNIVAVATPGAKSTTWTFSIPVPPAGATLHVYVNAVNVASQADRIGQQVSFDVAGSKSAPQLTTSAVFLVPDASFSASGSGFAAGETVTLSIDGARIGSATTNASGTFQATLSAPTDNFFGPTSLTATGGMSKKVAIAGIDIANEWLQAGSDVAHTGFENNDAIFSHVIAPGNNNYLALAWYYAAGAPVESSPAVYEAQVFFGNDAGTMAAVQTDTAAPVWTSKIPSGAAIRSTPAIDTSTGDLTFTADDGVAYVVATATGKAVGSAKIGGLPTSAAVFGGTMYVGSDNATLNAIGEKTGKSIWSRKFAGALHAAPALDTASKLLVVGDDSGAVGAYNSATGAPIWQTATAGTVIATPMIAAGAVYIASTSGNLYALNEQSGAIIWKYAAKTSLSTGAAFDAKLALVYFGGANGTLYAVNANTGTLAWTTVPQYIPLSPYVGIGAATSEVFANTASGALISYRSSQFGRFNSNHNTASSLTTAPAVNDGTVYVGANDGGVYAYTTTGALPQRIPQSLRRSALAIAATQQHPEWPAKLPVRAAFSWAEQRAIPLQIDTIGSPSKSVAAAPPRYHGGLVQDAPRSYVVFWNPGAIGVEQQYVPSVTSRLSAGSHTSGGIPLAGAYVDTAPYPSRLTDDVMQTEIARAIAVNHWKVESNAQFILLPASGAIFMNPSFCSYHSAFAFGHDRSKLAIYAVIPYSGAVSACPTTAGFERSGDSAVDAALANLRRVQREMQNDPLSHWLESFGRR